MRRKKVTKLNNKEDELWNKHTKEIHALKKELQEDNKMNFTKQELECKEELVIVKESHVKEEGELSSNVALAVEISQLREANTKLQAELEDAKKALHKGIEVVQATKEEVVTEKAELKERLEATSTWVEVVKKHKPMDIRHQQDNGSHP